MTNETGDSSFAYVAYGNADGVARRLAGIGGRTLQSSARATLVTTAQRDFRSIARRSGADILIQTGARRVSDPLEVLTVVIDAATLEERPLRRRRVEPSGLGALESQLAADIAGAVLRVGLPAAPRRPAHEIYSNRIA